MTLQQIHRYVGYVKWVAVFMVAVLICAPAAYLSAANEPQLPPTYLSAVALYAPDGTFVKLEISTNRFATCKDALEDTMSAIQKGWTIAPPGARTVGQCIPIRTYALSDLVGKEGAAP